MRMNNYYYKTKKVFGLFWKCEKYHIVWGYINTGYGFTKKQAFKNS